MDTARRSARGSRRRRSGSPLFAQLLTAAVESAADAVAIRFNPTGDPADARELTYRELDEASSKVARELIERGIGPGDVVAIGIARSIESVLSVWAVAKTGAAYVPVDPSYPPERIEYLLTDSGAALGLTTSAHRSALGTAVYWIELDDPVRKERIAARPGHPISYADRVRPLTEQHPAYVIYTSGSTGRPKGVVVTHTGLAGLVAAEREHYGVTGDSRVLHVCSPNFDVSVLELLLTFSSGATLVVSPPKVFGGDDLAELLRRERVSHMLITPAALESVDPSGLDELEVVVVAGDKFGPELVARWATGDREFYNGYGPTEATILATSTAAMVPGEPITIGPAIAGVGAFVLDTRLRPVPAGVTGELYLSGPALAQGYLARPGLTSERFVASPFGADTGNPGARLYRTGDLVRRREDGVIEYLGRSDFQVKIRGLRIELGEIDTALTSHPDIDFAVTMGKTLPSGATALVAYVMAKPGRAADPAALADHVGRSLPAHMVPSAIVVLDELPLTSNGKLDREALPEPVFETAATRAPVGEIEQKIATLFGELLRMDEVGADDSFFAIGGDSILSIQLVSRARQAGIVFTPQDVFEQRTVAGLAKVAVVGDGNVVAALEELDGGGAGEIPLTPVLADYLEDGVFSRFSQSMVLTLPDEIDRAGIAETLGGVLAHHDILRARLVQADGRFRLEVPEAGALDTDALIAEVRVPAGVADEELARIGSAAMDATLDALDPVGGRMLAFTWLRRPDAKDVLLVAAHHFVIDGVSWRILISDLVAAWVQRAAGQRISLPAIGTSFRRWAHGLAEAATGETRVGEVEYWRDVLATPDPLLGARELDSAVDTFATVRRFTVQVPADITETVLTEVPALYRGGVNDGLLAALALAVRSWRSRRGIDAPVTRVRLEGHGREESAVPGADITRTIGWFTSVYPVALDLSGIDTAAALEGGATTAAALRSVKEQLIAVPGKGIGFGLLRHLNPETAAELEGRLAQIGFNYLGRVSANEVPEGMADAAWLPTEALGELSVDQDPTMPAGMVVDFNAIVTDDEDGRPRMSISVQYAAEILDETAARELADGWVEALAAVARHVQDPAAGGLTPSDVPLVRVAQPELDTWRVTYPGLSDVLPLSPLGAGLLFHTQLTQGAADDYVTQFALELAGTVDLERLHRASQAILDRHDGLRAAFVTAADGTPVQIVVDSLDAPWRVVEGVADEDIPALLEEDQRTRFEPSQAPLMRFTVYRTTSGRLHFVLTTHHLLFDGWSLPLLMKDLLVLYATHGDSSLLPPVRPYRDYLAWLSEQDHEATLEKWRTTLAGAQPTALTTVLERPEAREIGYGEIEFEFSEEETAAVTAFAADSEVTVNIVVQAAWALVLATLTDRDDVVFGAVVSGRPPQLDGVDDMIGLFVNTIPVRVRFDAESTVRELLTKVQSEQAGLLEHHYLGLAEIQSAAGTGAAFDSLVAYESYPVDAEGLQAAGGSIDGLEVAGIKSVTFTHYPVTVVVESGACLRFKVWHRRDTIDAPAARALADLLRMILGRFVAAAPHAVVVQPNWWHAGALPGQLELPADRTRPATPSRRGGELRFDVPGEVHAALDQLARQHGSTVLTVVHAAFAVLLSRISGGTRDITMGALLPEFGEVRTDSAANAYVLRTEIDPGIAFTDLLDTLTSTDAETVSRAGGPEEPLADILDVVRSAAGHPPFQVLLSAAGAGQSQQTALVDLQLDVTEREDGQGVVLTFTYATDLFDPATVLDFADRLGRILGAVAVDNTAVVGDIDVYAPGERELVLNAWNTPGMPVPDVTLVDLIAAQAAHRPDAPAVRYGDTTLTFDQLLRRANTVARALIAYGAGPESLVAVAVPRTEELPVALLAVLISGAGYLPIDTAYPAQRLEFMLGDANPACVLTTTDERNAVPSGDIPVVLLDGVPGFSDAPVTDADRRAPLLADHLAYVIYTSGSTGVPKGVGVAHRNVVELFANTQAHFEFDENDVWTLFHSFAFDFSVWELWCALANGGTVVVVDHLTSRSPEQFRDLLIRERVTVLNQTPSAFYQLAEADRAAHAQSGDYALRYVVFGGEALDLRQLRRWYERHPVDAPTLVNMYGITETTVHVSFLALDEELAELSSSVIGRALPGLGARVLDQRLNPAPVGVAGEIYVDGAQLSRGYLGRPGLTATRFVANPYGAPGSRMYRAGDVGRWCGFGGEANLEYAGRSDQQVQLRGFRIELGEIESALLRLPGISQAVVLVRDDNGVDQLVGYVVPEGDTVIDPVEAKVALGEFLTAYMVPDALVSLEALPLTPNGKLDRKALPAPEIVSSAQFRAPRTEIERVVAAEFADLLGAAEVGLDDDFFALGGNSLLATRAVARINEALDANIAVRELFEASTVAALAAKVVTGAAENRPPLVRTQRPDRVPLSLAQQRMWVINQIDPESPAYNIPLALRLSGALDVTALRRAVQDVLERHESLRTRYPVDGPGGLPYQEILPVAEAMPGGLGVEPLANALQRMTEVLASGFDVTTEVPVRALLCTDGDAGNEHYLVVVVHHIAGDGASLPPLARDLMMAYIARRQGNSPAWSPLAVQYADFALWQREVIGTDDDENSVAAGQLAYWRDQLGGAAGALELPLDRPRPAVRTMQGGATTFTVPAEVHDGLQRIAREHNASLFMVVHAALAVLLSRLSGSGDVTIGTPIAGRGERVLDDVVGMFVNTLALRTAVDSAASFDDLVDKARETDLAAYGNADIPFERVVEVVAPDRAAQDPLFQVVLSFQNTDRPDLELPGLSVTALDTGAVSAKFDLQVTIDPRQWEDGAVGELAGALTYASDIFDESTIRTFGERLQKVLAAVAQDSRQRVGAIEFGVAPVQRPVSVAAPAADTTVTRGTALPQLLTAAVEDDPDGPALVWGEDAVSYQELDARSSRLARVLISRGSGPGTGVALRLDRGVDAVVATWAVLKSGAAIVPALAGTELPADLVVKVGLTATAVAAANGVDWLVLTDPSLVAEIAAASPRPVTYANRTRALQGGDPAFVTGDRALSYDELAELVNKISGRTELTFESRTLRYGRQDTPAAVVETLAAGASGASVVVAAVESGALTDLLAEEWVTHLFTDRAGIGQLDGEPLEDLAAVIVDDGADIEAAQRISWLTTVVPLDQP